VDKAVKAGRTTPELAGRKKAHADLQQCFADEVPYVARPLGVAVIAANNVRITNGRCPTVSPRCPSAAPATSAASRGSRRPG
jgi:hypothetical protein